MSYTIQHRGVVQRIEGNKVFVTVEQQSACAGCHAKGICGTSGSQRIIEVATPHADSYNTGERVIVALLHKSMGFSSILWGYVLPLVVLMITLIASKLAGCNDGLAASITLGAIALYYIALYTMRRWFERKIKFTIIKE